MSLEVNIFSSVCRLTVVFWQIVMHTPHFHTHTCFWKEKKWKCTKNQKIEKFSKHENFNEHKTR